MNRSDFHFMAEWLKSRCGILMAPDRAKWMYGQLIPIARRRGHADVSGLMDELKNGSTPALVSTVVDSMTINETSFFRDPELFNRFRTIMLPGLMRARAQEKRIRIWSAACSSGQEPYSLAMILDGIDLQEWDIEIFATDINSKIVARAREGRFTHLDMQRGLTPDLLRYFQADGDFWRISEHLRDRVRFGNFNLQHAFETLGAFDIIFCRNVLMYFDADAKRDVLTRLQDILVDDGYLALGANETVLGATSTLNAVPGTHGIFTKAIREMRKAG